VSNTVTLENEVNIEFFPNPTNDLVHIIAEGLNDPQAVQLIDHTGKVVKDIKLETGVLEIHETIDVSQLLSGMYFIRFLDRSGMITRKLIKM